MGFASGRSVSSRSLLRAMASVCRPHLRKAVKATRADRYVKVYDSVGFALAWIAYYLLGLHSLRELQVWLSLSAELQRAVGWGNISKAQINRLHHVRPPELWGTLICHLLERLQGRQVPSYIRLLDTSFFSLGTRLLQRRYPRKRMGRGTVGIKLGVVLDPGNWLPVLVPPRVGQGCDTGWLDELVPPDKDVRGLLFIFDRGFRKYAFFERLMAAGAHFLTRATAVIEYEVVSTLPLDPAHPEVVCDQRVILGTVASHTRMKRPVRRIELITVSLPRGGRVGERLVFLTSDFETPAWELCELYRRRWDIELFFRWFKRTIGCSRPLGYSAEAAAHSFWAALVTYLLVLLIHQATAHPRPTATKTRTTTLIGLQSTLQTIRAVLTQRSPNHLLQALEFL